LGFRAALINSLRADTRIDSRRILIEDLNREFLQSVALHDGFIVVVRLSCESVIGNPLSPSCLPRPKPRRERSYIELVDHKLRYLFIWILPLFPAKQRGTYDRNRTANTTLIFIFNSRCPIIGPLQIVLVKRIRRCAFLSNPLSGPSQPLLESLLYDFQQLLRSSRSCESAAIPRT
jgi:hypothetical protein